MEDIRVGLPEDPPPPAPELWNPGAAAAWSLLFTPAFGSILHGLNWQKLGNHTKATLNFVWAAATGVFLAVNIALILLPESKTTEGGMRLVGFALLIGWYFGAGKGQVELVRGRYGNSYPRRGWTGPLLIAFAALIGYVGGAIAFGFVTYRATPEEIAEEIRPQILAEWRKNPAVGRASIQKIDLTTKDHKNYDGFVNATFDGRPARLQLRVVTEGWNMTWEVNPLAP